MKRLLFLFYVSFFITVLNIHSQEGSNNGFIEFISRANRFANTFPQEKVYLHLDNTSYYLKETIWLKAYVVNSDFHHPTDVSKTLYVELLNTQGDIIKKNVYKVEDGQAHGEIFLDNRLMSSGFYEIRAYTRYMLNFGTNDVFSRVLPVYEQPSKKGKYSDMTIKRPSITLPSKRENKSKLKKMNITFFPEGGSFVTDLTSRISFKATDNKGQNIDVEGIVYNSEKEEVAKFKTYHQGMGVFFLVPDGKEYTASVTWSGKKYNVKLPVAQQSGYSMRVINNNDYILASIFRSENETKDSIAMVSMCRGRSYLFKTLDMGDKKEYLMKLPVKELPGGVNEIILFNSEGKIICSRLVFIEPKDNLVINQTQDKTVYKPYEKVNMEFDLKNQAGTPIETSFSLSIKERSSLTKTHNNENIMVDMLLSSDLKGYIEKPSYYFELAGKDRTFALDLLLMTQGWSRYEWDKQIRPEEFSLKHLPENGISIDGKIFSSIRNTPRKNVDLTLLLTSEGKSVIETSKSDSLGRFYFTGNLYGEWDAIIQTKEKNKKKDYRVMLNRLFSPIPKAYSFYDTRIIKEPLANQIPDKSKPGFGTEVEFELSADSSSNKGMTERDHMLGTVTVKGKRKDNDTNESLSQADIVYDVDQTLDAITDAGDYVGDDIFEFLSKTNHNFFRFYRGSKPSYQYLTYPITFVIDGESLQRSGWSSIEDVPLGMVEKISISRYKISSTSELYDETLGNINENESGTSSDLSTIDDGEENEEESPNNNNNQQNIKDAFKDRVYVYLYTYKDGQYRGIHKGIRRATINGYTYSKEFYSPKYDYTVFPDEKDYRRTLYWNPNVKSDSTGVAKISFYNNSTCRDMRIDAETITREGSIGILSK